MSRNATTGEPQLEGDYLINAQGEDVVAGTRATLPIKQLGDDMPENYAELEAIAKRLEIHHRNMQDMEFTVEQGKLWLLQTRDGKRTAQAEVRIAADMVDEGLISKEEAVLQRAGIKKAKGMITALATDADNVFLVLIAKQLNPKLFIVARAEQNIVKKTLLAAGADKVISPYDLGARRMAHAILRPTVIRFLEMAFADESVDIQIEEIHVTPNSTMVGMTLQDSGIRQNYDLMIIVIQKPDGSMVFNPKASTMVEAGCVMVVVGSAKSIKQLELNLPSI
jgi:Trk K+ transport system NAD-binding subunit